MTERWGGNWRLASLVFERSRAEAAARHVALEVAHRANSRDGWTDATLDDLVHATHHNRRTVMRALELLEHSLELEVDRSRGEGRRRRYRIRTEVLNDAPAKQPPGGSRNAPPSGSPNAPPSGSQNAPPDGTTYPQSAPPARSEMHQTGSRNAPPAVHLPNLARAYPENQISRKAESPTPTGEGKPAKYFEDLWRARCLDHQLVSFPQDVALAGQGALRAQTAGIPLVAILEAINAAVLEKQADRVQSIAAQLASQPMIASRPAAAP
jgi:hypothetical protein